MLMLSLSSKHLSVSTLQSDNLHLNCRRTYFWASKLQSHEEKSHTSWLEPADECWDGGVAAKLVVPGRRLWIVWRVTYCMYVCM